MTPADGEGPRLRPFKIYESSIDPPFAPGNDDDLPEPHDDTEFKPSLRDHLAHYSARLRMLTARYDNYVTRAGLRFISGLMTGGLSGSALLQLPEDVGVERFFDAALAVLFGVGLIWLTRRSWFNGGRGTAFALFLWAVSGVWVNGVTTIAFTFWQYATGEVTDTNEVITFFGIGVVLLIAATAALKKFDPDY
jgi:hypothetical protein